MSTGPNYGLSKGMVVPNNAAVVLGEIYTSDTAEQSAKRCTTANPLTPMFVAGENVDAVKTATGKVFAKMDFSGISLVKLGGTVTKDAKVGCNASALGVAVTRAIAGAQPVPILGVAMTAGISGDLIPVWLQPGASY